MGLWVARALNSFGIILNLIRSPSSEQRIKHDCHNSLPGLYDAQGDLF